MTLERMCRSLILVLVASACPCFSGQTALKPFAAASVVIAARNSPERAQASVVCSGIADQDCINQAIAAHCPNGGAEGIHGCRVVLLNGVYNISGPVVLDDDDISLEGEQHCMWGGYNGAWTSPERPTGTIGTGCSQIRAAAAGFDLIQIQHHYVSSNAGDKGRHRGINIEKLYIVGFNYSNAGIATKGDFGGTAGGILIKGGCCAGDDNVSIIDNVIQRTEYGMVLRLDTVDAERNSIQDISGTAMAMDGNFGRITNNLLFDVGGGGIISNAMGTVIADNLIGSTWGGPAVSVYGAHTVVANNSFFQVNAGGVWLFGARGGNVTGNVVNNLARYGRQSKTHVDAFKADEKSVGISFTSNSCDAEEAKGEVTGYCVENLGSGGVVTGNTALGNWHGATAFAPGSATAGVNYPGK